MLTISSFYGKQCDFVRNGIHCIGDGKPTPPMQMELAECSETLAHTIQTPDNQPKERLQNSGHGESVKSIKLIVIYRVYTKEWCGFKS